MAGQGGNHNNDGAAVSYAAVIPAGTGGGAHGGSGGKRKKGGVWRVVFWVALIVCIASAAVLGYILWSYWHADTQYKSVAERAGATEAMFDPGKNLSDLTVDWDYLRSVNPEVVAWVYVPGTPINYPVCFSGDNLTYLNKDFNGAVGFGWAAKTGCIFLDENNKTDFSDANNILYGHHMNDGSMFAAISQNLERSDENFNACRTVYVLTPQMNYRASTFSVVVTDGSDLLAQPNFVDDTDRSNYVRDKIDRSVVQPAEGMPDPMDVKKMFMLSTCDYSRDDGRSILYADVVETAVPGSGTSTGATGDVSDDEAAEVEDAAKQAA